MTHLNPDTFDLYLDDQLNPAEHAAVEAHLAECSVCSQELASLSNVFATLESLEPERIPVDLTRRVMSQVAPASPIKNSRIVGALLVFQVAVAVVLAVWLLPSVAAWPSAGLPTFSFSLDIADWLAIVPGSRAAFPDMDLGIIWTFLSQVTWVEWSVLIMIAGIIWLAGNYRLLMNTGQEFSEVSR